MIATKILNRDERIQETGDHIPSNFEKKNVFNDKTCIYLTTARYLFKGKRYTTSFPDEYDVLYRDAKENRRNCI